MYYQISKDFVIDARDRLPACSMTTFHHHQFNEIYFLHSGSCDVWIEENFYHLESGNVLFIPANLPHKFVYTCTEPIKRTVLYLSTEQIQWYFKDCITEVMVLFSDRFIAYSKKSASTVQFLLKKILFEKYAIDQLSAAMTRTYFFELILFLVRCHKYTNHMNQKTDLSNLTIGKILKYIELNYNKPLTLSAIAAQFSLSESSLTRKFKSYTGLNFKEYVNKVRIDSSKHLLVTTNNTITEIGYLCGYSNSHFFSDTFRKETGMSPSQYRKMLSMK